MVSLVLLVFDESGCLETNPDFMDPETHSERRRPRDPDRRDGGPHHQATSSAEAPKRIHFKLKDTHDLGPD